MGNYSKGNKILIHPSDHKNKRDWGGILKFLDKNLDYPLLSDFADLGAGMSNIGVHISEKNPRCRVVSIDTSKDLLAVSKKRAPSIKTICHDINNPLPFPDQSFDFVSCIGTLHYGCIRDPGFVLGEMARVARKIILVDFFVKNSPYSWLLSVRHPNYNARKCSRKEAEKLLGSICEFKVWDVVGGRTPFGGLLPYSGRDVFYLLEK
jgi:ubiquinone/menaquinone biosynthesis C-methylase UbiE